MQENQKSLKVVDSLHKELRHLGLESNWLNAVSSILKPNCDSLNHWLELAQILRSRGAYSASNTVYQHASRLFDTSAMLWNNFGILLREWGRLDDALEAFDRATSLDNSYVKPLENKGRILELLERYAEAIKVYEKALELGPDNASTINNMGVCNLALSNDKNAEKWFRKALSIDAQHTNAMFNLASLLVNRSSIQEASTYISKLEMLLPDDDGVRELSKLLSKTSSFKPSVPTIDFGADSSKRQNFLRKLRNEIAGDPKSLFISYAWPDASTKELAFRLSRDLRAHGYNTIIDIDYDLTAEEVLYLLASCQNVLFLNDVHFVESCLLGKIPITQKTKFFPSFAMPKSYLHDLDKLERVIKITFYAWQTASLLVKNSPDSHDIILEDIWNKHRDSFEHLPDLRFFVEGWRLDEVQMVFSRLSKYRSVSIAYVNGSNCLSGYPVVDCSSPMLYDRSIATLVSFLELNIKHAQFGSPVKVDIDPLEYKYMSREIKDAVRWRVSSEDVVVMRADKIREDNKFGVSICRDWELVSS